MIGSLKIGSERDREAVVIGAGISGLLIAYVLDRNGFKVTLYEAEKRAGGLIHTTRNEWGLVESAAHSFLVTDEVSEICQDLGVKLSEIRPGSRARYIFRNGKMRRFPLSILEAFRTFLRAYFVLSREGMSRGEATLEQWGNRHLGDAAVKYLLSPFLTGIYAARPSEISVGAAFPALEVPVGQSLLSAQLRKLRLRFFAPERRGGQRSQTRKKMMVPEQGMGALVGALEKRLEERLGDRFKRDEKLNRLPEAANVVLAVPAPQASMLLAGKDDALSNALSEIEYSPLVSATIFVPKNEFKKSPPAGVGVLIPECEKRRCLGILFNSSAFPGRASDESNWVSLTMMLGGTIDPGLVERADDKNGDDELLESVRNELKTILELNDAGAQSARIFVHRWPRAIPRYDARILKAWATARSGWCSVPGQILAGNYTGQVSIRGMMQEAYALGSNLAAGLHLK